MKTHVKNAVTGIKPPSADPRAFRPGHHEIIRNALTGPRTPPKRVIANEVITGRWDLAGNGVVGSLEASLRANLCRKAFNNFPGPQNPPKAMKRANGRTDVRTDGRTGERPKDGRACACY